MLEQPRVSYHIDHGREILWILHRKNAGTSLRHAFGAGRGDVTGGVGAADALAWNGYHTISSIRHPWDRITSGLYNPYDDDRPFERKIREEILTRPSARHIDSHLWPQWVTLEGFRVDRWLRFDRLREDWEAFAE